MNDTQASSTTNGSSAVCFSCRHWRASKSSEKNGICLAQYGVAKLCNDTCFRWKAEVPFGTEQEEFWEGSFGNEYTARNKGDGIVASNTAFFGKAMSLTRNVRTVLELGSNIGLNLLAIKRLLPEAELSAVEINDEASFGLQSNIPEVDLHIGSILAFSPQRTWDFVFTKGVLIHINPERMSDAYEVMYRSSSRYIMVAEYYNPNPVEIPYRGHSGKLFKRDFAGEMIGLFPDLELIDYGFSYHLDQNFPQDDLTWFLMEKKSVRS